MSFLKYKHSLNEKFSIFSNILEVGTIISEWVSQRHLVDTHFKAAAVVLVK